MTLGSARALVRTARKDGHADVRSVRFGFASCPVYTVYVGAKSFTTRADYQQWQDANRLEAWQREQAGKEREAR